MNLFNSIISFIFPKPKIKKPYLGPNFIMDEKVRLKTNSEVGFVCGHLSSDNQLIKVDIEWISGGVSTHSPYDLEKVTD